MSRDPIIDEVRRSREREAAKHGFDVEAILAAAKKQQRRTKHKLVSFASKPAVVPPAPSEFGMELIFEIRDAEESGYYARALGHAIFTQAETWEELRNNAGGRVATL
ncbi:MAG: hypothetical protein ABSG13_07850 [Bryobacteraceae bacterium]|jgi:ribosomal protein L14